MVDISFFDNRSEVDISDYVVSNEWELLDQPGRRNVVYYACCEQPYPDLTFMLRMRRLSAFYNYTIMLPCVLLSCLTAVIFWLPPESPAKIMLGMSLFCLWSTQPGHPFVGRRNEYQPKDGDALRLGSKDKYGSCVGGV